MSESRLVVGLVDRCRSKVVRCMRDRWREEYQLDQNLNTRLQARRRYLSRSRRVVLVSSCMNQRELMSAYDSPAFAEAWATARQRSNFLVSAGLTLYAQSQIYIP